MKKRVVGPIPTWPSTEAAKTQLEARPLVTVTDETLPYTPRTPPAAKGMRYQLTVVEPDALAAQAEVGPGPCSVGSHQRNGLVIADETVSRFHCELQVTPEGAQVKDLGSLNGTMVDGVRVQVAWLRDGSLLRLGRVALRFELVGTPQPLTLSARTTLGTLVGTSVAMRGAFGLIERAAPSQSTILLEGETGTGKSQAAKLIHELSPRAKGPFMVVDCGALPTELLDSELFGHEKGAFTGALARRLGAFEEARGGTVFIDEVGELPLELQARLLRVLEERVVKRVGSNQSLEVDVRVVAAAQTDLRSEVNARHFRSDLYFRLAVVRVQLPSLRERPEDIPPLMHKLLGELGASPEAVKRLATSEFINRLQHAAWPGNIRELRNHLERCLLIDQPLAPEQQGRPLPAEPEALRGSLADLRHSAIERLERRYLEVLLERHRGQVSSAAVEADVARAYLYRLLKKYRLSSGQ
jgi:two-component system, NtrC family, response regulator GlrR